MIDGPCLEGGLDDYLLQERYTVGFLLDGWYRLPQVTGDWTDPGVDPVLQLRERFGAYQRRSCESNRMPGEPRVASSYSERPNDLGESRTKAESD